ncbi:MAG TPA: HAMP domain-containing sensor histidine kinase [Ramlibacter sp.]|nr:HAMP domain-containing sensor histidine kinase [Ramlibacter sp.]
MSAALAWWERMRQPTLQRRSVAYVLVGFMVIWLVLVGYAYVQNERIVAQEQPFRRFTEALHRTLEATPQPEHAAAIVRATLQWLNERRAQGPRFPPGLEAELLDASGRRVYASPRMEALSTAAWREGARVQVAGQPYARYEVRGPLWTLRVWEPVRTTDRFLSYNASVILEYLLLALPFVLVPVWWSVRSGLRPLSQFAAALKDRRQGDLGPVRHPVRHSELKPLSEALDDLLAQLRRKLDRERVFVQDAAHEIRTPLAVVGTQAHVLAHASCAEERQRAQVLLNQAIARASHLAHQLLLLATLDGEARAAPRRIDVAQAARELLAQLAPLAMERRMELSLEAPDQLWLTVDEGAFGSILGNLVDNAIRYGREGGNAVVSLRQEGEDLLLHVQDDGPGIPQAERARIFERFYRVPGSECQGSGLGLAIVQQAATRLLGEVEVTDGLAGGGVGFFVRLPVPAADPAGAHGAIVAA